MVNKQVRKKPPSRIPAIDQAEAEFLGSILEKTHALADNLNNQTSILVGVSSALFVFSFSQFISGRENFFFVVLSLFTGATSLIGLLAVHPPRFLRKRNQPESLMYNRQITNSSSPDDYAKLLLSTMESREAIVKEYAREIYNVSKYYYRPRRRLFNLARDIFMIGMIVTFLIFIASFV